MSHIKYFIFLYNSVDENEKHLIVIIRKGYFYYRKDTKVIYLRNSTQLPVRWRLSGLENLGDDFTVASDTGIVEPKSEYALNAYFRAMKPVQTNKKMIRMEVSYN